MSARSAAVGYRLHGLLHACSNNSIVLGELVVDPQVRRFGPVAVELCLAGGLLDYVHDRSAEEHRDYPLQEAFPGRGRSDECHDLSLLKLLLVEALQGEREPPDEPLILFARLAAEHARDDCASGAPVTLDRRYVCRTSRDQ